MFDKKVSLEIPEERKIIKKRIGGKEIQMYDSMTDQEVAYCIKETMDIYYNDSFQENKDALITPIEIFANLDILSLQLCTNIDVSKFSFEELCKLNIHEFLKKNLGGFTMLESALIVSVQHIHTMKILEGFDHVASIDDLEMAGEETQKMLEEGAPEQLKELLALQIANNPTLSKFYEKYVDIVEEDKSGLDK